jgi:kynurenine formamidase
VSALSRGFSGRVIDLTCEAYNGMPTYPGDPPFRHEFVLTGSREGEVTLSRLEAGSHSGTHVDAPLHFIPGGLSVDRIPPERLVLPADFVDLSYKRPKEAITSRDLEGKVHAGRAAALYTGFSRLRGSEDYLHAWPYLSRDAADYLAGVGVGAVMTEAMSVSGWAGAKGYPWPPLVSEEEAAYVHVRLLSSGVIIVEGACNLGELASCRDPLLVIAPLKVRGAEGAMARVLALC